MGRKSGIITHGKVWQLIQEIFRYLCCSKTKHSFKAKVYGHSVYVDCEDFRNWLANFNKINARALSTLDLKRTLMALIRDAKPKPNTPPPTVPTTPPKSPSSTSYIDSSSSSEGDSLSSEVSTPSVKPPEKTPSVVPPLNLAPMNSQPQAGQQTVSQASTKSTTPPTTTPPTRASVTTSAVNPDPGLVEELKKSLKQRKKLRRKSLATPLILNRLIPTMRSLAKQTH